MITQIKYNTYLISTMRVGAKVYDLDVEEINDFILGDVYEVFKPDIENLHCWCTMTPIAFNTVLFECDFIVKYKPKVQDIGQTNKLIYNYMSESYVIPNNN